MPKHLRTHNRYTRNVPYISPFLTFNSQKLFYDKCISIIYRKNNQNHRILSTEKVWHAFMHTVKHNNKITYRQKTALEVAHVSWENHDGVLLCYPG